MVDCPRCGSDSVQAIQEKPASTTVIFDEWVFIDEKGGGIFNHCLNCGTTWNAASLMALRQEIKEYVVLSINLKLYRHRSYLIAYSNNMVTETARYRNRCKEIANISRDPFSGFGFRLWLSLGASAFFVLCAFASLLGGDIGSVMVLAILIAISTSIFRRHYDDWKTPKAQLRNKAFQEFDAALKKFKKAYPTPRAERIGGN